MSEQLSFDRKKGFVALPVEVLDLDLSPGAFRTLVELCRMANLDGFCWPSMRQLSDQLGRSKASISSYVKDLRDAGLLETQEQKTSNGYNYRLKYRVTFWQEWRASLRGTTKTKIERSVQPVERPKESKNQINLNHHLGKMDEILDDLIKSWTKCFSKAPYPTVAHLPSPEQIAKTRQFLSSPQKQGRPISQSMLDDLWKTLGLVPNVKDAGYCEALSKSSYSTEELDAILSHIRNNWPPHWRHQPSGKQLQTLIAAAGVIAREDKLSLLRSYEKRWVLAQKSLQSRVVSGSLCAKELAAFCAVA